jgi:uncharacterized protein (DUF2384 family)
VKENGLKGLKHVRVLVDAQHKEEVQLLQKALRIAGSPARLEQWVRTPISSLNGQTPYAAMQSPQGRKDVAAVLTRIEHGVY